MMAGRYGQQLAELVHYLTRFIEEIEEFKNSLAPNYDRHALEDLGDHYQGITERFDNHVNYERDPFYNIIGTSERRTTLAEQIGEAALAVTIQCEKYAKGEENYSRATIRRLLNNLSIYARSLYDSCLSSGGVVSAKSEPKSRSSATDYPVAQTPSKVSAKPEAQPRSSVSGSSRTLHVFLCHSSDDKSSVRDLYRRLSDERNIEAWLDEKMILPGQNWDFEIKNAIRKSDVIIVCLSRGSINKEGYVQKEITQALDIADEKPEGTIFVIPLRLEKCDVPKRLNRWQWVDFFEDGGYQQLMRALQHRAIALGMSIESNT